MDDERPTVITIPTELDRSDAFIALSATAAVILVCWWTLQRGIPPPLVLIPGALMLVWALTSRSATEVRGIGAIAVAVRNRIGERDVHEWTLAYLHYVHLVYLPIWKAQCARLLRYVRQRVSRWRR